MKLLCALLRAILSLMLTVFGISCLFFAYDYYLSQKYPHRYVVIDQHNQG